jgi:hypothetical protein
MADRYVRASGGDDGATGATFALGWATLQFAFDTIAAGDTLYVCGNFTITATVDIDVTTGTITEPVYVRGADASGNAYAGTGASTITTTTNSLTSGLIKFAANMSFWRFYDFVFDGGGNGKATYGIHQSAATSQGCYFERCRVTNCSNSGVVLYSTVSTKLVMCSIDNNGKGGTGHGVNCYSTSGGAVILYCTINNNASSGVLLDRGIVMIGCLVYSNGADGLALGTTGDYSQCYNSTFYNNGSDGIQIASTTDATYIVNCSLVGNGAYGLSFASGDIDNFSLIGWNHFHGNATAAYSGGGGTPPGTYNQSGDPLFTNVTAGSENFAPGIGSPLIGNGMPGSGIGGTSYTDIGAIQIRTAGGLILPPGLTGGMRG